MIDKLSIFLIHYTVILISFNLIHRKIKLGGVIVGKHSMSQLIEIENKG